MEFRYHSCSALARSRRALFRICLPALFISASGIQDFAAAQQVCPVWGWLGVWGNHNFYGRSMPDPVNQGWAWEWSVNPGHHSDTVQSCAIGGGAFPAQWGLCTVLHTCGPPACSAQQSYTDQTVVNQVANPQPCPAGWTPDPANPCNCIPPPL